MFDDDIVWRIVELPQQVDDNQIPFSNYYITEYDVIVAHIIGDYEVAYQMVKRLNQWEDYEREQMRKDNEADRRAMGLEDHF